MKYAILVLCAAALSGCASEKLKPRVTSTGERTVVVESILSDLAGSTKLAEAECKKNGRYARLNLQTAGLEYVFDCVE